MLTNSNTTLYTQHKIFLLKILLEINACRRVLATIKQFDIWTEVK